MVYRLTPEQDRVIQERLAAAKEALREQGLWSRLATTSSVICALLDAGIAATGNEVSPLVSPIPPLSPSSYRAPVVEPSGQDLAPRQESTADPRGGSTPAAAAAPKPGGHGSRLPEPFDFVSHPGLLEYSLSLGFTAQEAAATLENFTDYWRACAGQKGRKLDWPATWRTWVRKERDDRVNRRGRPGGAPASRNGRRPSGAPQYRQGTYAPSDED